MVATASGEKERREEERKQKKESKRKKRTCSFVCALVTKSRPTLMRGRRNAVTSGVTWSPSRWHTFCATICTSPFNNQYTHSLVTRSLLLSTLSTSHFSYIHFHYIYFPCKFSFFESASVPFPSINWASYNKLHCSLLALGLQPKVSKWITWKNITIYYWLLWLMASWLHW